MAGLLRRLTAAFVLIALACWPVPLTAQSQPGISDLEASGIEFHTVDGARLAFADLRGKVVLIDFWATWCAPCLVELPRLRRLHEELGGGRLVIIGVSLDATERRRLASWLRRNAIGWPQVHDGRGYDGALARRFAVEQLPATALFDPAGRLAARDLRGAPLEAAIRRLVAGVSRH